MLTALQNFSRNSQPKELNMRMFISPMPSLTGVYFGTRADFDKIMAPLLEAMGIDSTARPQVQSYTWLNTLSQFSNGPLPQPEIYDQHETFFAKSLMPQWLSPAAIDALSKYWESYARNLRRGWYLLIDCSGGVDSAVSKIPSDASAYPHRNATFKMQFYDVAFGTYDPKWTDFLNGWVDSIVAADPTIGHPMYVNYADTSLSPKEAHNNYWLGNYERLAKLKEVWDPKYVFGGPQLVGDKVVPMGDGEAEGI